MTDQAHEHDFSCKVLQCVTVCCSVLQCVAVCCSVLQCVAACCSVLQSLPIKLTSMIFLHFFQLIHLIRSHGINICHQHPIFLRRCVAACCSVLQCVAVCCSMLQCRRKFVISTPHFCSVVQCDAVCCCVLQCIVDCYSVGT